MTGTEMNANLGLRLEDPAEGVFTSQAKIDAINLAQKTTVNMLDNGYLTELEAINDNTGLTSGSVSFATAGITPIRGGITGIYDETNDKWCTMIEPKDLKRLENSYLSGTSSNALAYIFNQTIYVKPTSVTTIDIWYLKSPTDFAISPGAGQQALSSSCELNTALHELVLDFAEAQLWRMDAKADRAQSAYTSALNLVKVLNERYQIEKPEGIGTKGR
tara:strand:- start:3280 stop:3933 length:654 start_codon:yes stop_codon:yes gene_type:complete